MSQPDNIKAADLKLKLSTDAGMESVTDCRVSVAQWADIDAIIHGNLTAREQRMRFFLDKIKGGLMFDHKAEAQSILDDLEKPRGIDGPASNTLKAETRHYTVGLDVDTGRGWFEHLIYGDEKGGGLWIAPLATVNGEGICQTCGREFGDLKDCPCPSDDCPSNKEEKAFELTDYDGMSYLPSEVICQLREWGITVGPDFE